MKELIELLRTRLAAGEDLALCTVVERSGSAPRGAGAQMLVGRTGRLWGSVGGGLLEHQAAVLADSVLQTKRGLVQAFSLNHSGLDASGMVCGGNMTVLIQYLPAGDAGLLACAEETRRALRERRDGWLVFTLDGAGRGGIALRSAEQLSAHCPSQDHAPANRSFVRGEDGDTYLERLPSGGLVYLFGGGHVAREVSPLLARVGFRHVVMDDRPDFSHPEDFPAAEQVLCHDFARLLEVVSPNPGDYAAVMTHGHGADFDVQTQLLTTPIGYIGVMGSRRKKEYVFARLREVGFTDADLDRVTTPIGLSIGGESPAEIALSIVAQLVQLRAAREA